MQLNICAVIQDNPAYGSVPIPIIIFIILQRSQIELKIGYTQRQANSYIEASCKKVIQHVCTCAKRLSVQQDYQVFYERFCIVARKSVCWLCIGFQLEAGVWYPLQNTCFYCPQLIYHWLIKRIITEHHTVTAKLNTCDWCVQ